MIVDSSAIVAILQAELGAEVFARLISDAPIVRMSAATYVELGVVMDRTGDPVLSGTLDRFLEEARVVIEPFTASQARLARDAYRHFGKGTGHPARLNMGDCFAYALARDLGEPLLFKGDDFRLTDIEIVTEPIRHKRLSEVVAAYGVGAP